MITVLQDKGGNIRQVSADIASVLFDDFGPDAWQLTIRTYDDIEHKIMLRKYPKQTGPIILEGENFKLDYSKENSLGT